MVAITGLISPNRSKRYLVASGVFVLLLILALGFRSVRHQPQKATQPEEVLHLRPQSLWGQVRHEFVQPWKNLYEFDFRYPDHGISIFVIDELPYRKEMNRKYLSYSINQCRESFGDAYRLQSLLRPAMDGRPIPFSIKFVVIIIQNRAEHQNTRSFEKSHKFGVVLPASEVFDTSKDTNSIAETCELDYFPISFSIPTAEEEKNGYSPMSHLRYLVIDRTLK